MSSCDSLLQRVWLLSSFAYIACADLALFAVPFEISFSGTNEFSVTVDHLYDFIGATSAFFGVADSNISIAFANEVSATDYLDVGFTVEVQSAAEKERVESIDINAFRAYLLSMNSLPTIIGIEGKHIECPTTAQYGTFTNVSAIECEWLCDETSMYDQANNECEASTTTEMTEQDRITRIKEGNAVRFGYVGVGSAVLFTIFLALIKCKGANNQASKDQAPPNALQRRESVYFYKDDEKNENDGDDDGVQGEEDIQDNGKSAADIALSVKTSRANSVEPQTAATSATSASPALETDAMFREATLAPLEEVECEESLMKTRSIMIEKARLQQYKLMDSLDAYRKELNVQSEPEASEAQQALKRSYLEKRERVMQESFGDDVEDDKKKKADEIQRLESEYNAQREAIQQETEQNKQTKLKQFKDDIQTQLLFIKNDIKQKLNDLQGEQ